MNQNIKTLLLTIVFIFVTAITGYIIREIIVEKERSILYDADFLINEAMSQSYNRRLKSVDHYYYRDMISHDWPKKEIRFETEEGVRIRTDVDSIRALSEENKIRTVNETVLLFENPINPDSLNVCFQQVLDERGLYLLTGIRYTEVENEKTFYSENDSLFFATAKPLKEYQTGLFDEIIIQGYVKIPYITLVEKAGFRFFVLVFVWIALFFLYVTFLYKTYRDKRKNIAEIEGKLTEVLRLDADKCFLYYKEQEVELTPNLSQLMELFLSKPDNFLSKEEIANELWKGLDDHSNRLSQIIKRLRTTIAHLHGVEIRTVRGAGFQLVVN